MNSKELRGLYEAYQQVNAPQELDEASRADDTTRANIARYAGRKGISFEPGPNWDPSANRGKGAHLSPKQKEKQRRKALRQEELDIFDTVLEFLQAEGFAETLEEAEWMMANVIDEEAIEIVVGEGYQRNPEKGEKEDKKYAPVRGEKTPMPPRGDKRREDFEKWYAKQMGR